MLPANARTAEEELLHRVNRAMQAARSFRLEGTLEVRESESSSHPALRATVQVQGRRDGDGRLVAEGMTGPGGRPVSMESRWVDGARYVRDPSDGTWEARGKLPRGTPDRLLRDALQGRLGLSEIRVGRAGFLNGGPMFRIHGSITVHGSPATITLWAADDDLRIRRIRVEGPVPASWFPPLGGAQSNTVFAITDLRVASFDLPFAVQVPDGVVRETRIESPYGPMALYRGRRAPFRFQYPARWRKAPPNPNVTATFGRPEDGRYLVVSEEPLEAEGHRAENLGDYLHLVFSTMETNVPDFELISSRRVRLGALRAQVLTFRVDGGALTVRRFIYLHEGIGVNITYVVRTERFDEMEPLVDYSQRSFELLPDEPPGGS